LFCHELEHGPYLALIILSALLGITEKFKTFPIRKCYCSLICCDFIEIPTTIAQKIATEIAAEDADISDC
jgi:hypothetical protein